MTETAYEKVTHALSRVTQWTPPNERGDWRCPAHNDSTASLSVSRGEKGVVLKCQAGCETTAVVEALGLAMRDLFDEQRDDRRDERPREVAAYDYVDPTGALLYQVVRMEPKTFRQRRPADGGGWEWSLNGIKRVLYRLPDVIAAVKAASTIYITEGEKDAEAIIRAGQAATCNPGGAGKWPHIDPAPLYGATDVVIVRDKDPAGIKHAADVEASLVGKVGRVRIVEAITGKDAADHLGAGHGLDDFAIISDSQPELDRSLYPIDLEPVLAGEYAQPVPIQLFRNDGRCLFYEGVVNGIHGDSGTGKGWVICHLIHQNANAGRRTMLLDFEDIEQSITARLQALGMTAYEILNWLVYLRPQVPIDRDAVNHLTRLVTDRNVSSVVIDSLGEAFSLEGINEDKDVEVGPWLRRVARPLAETNAAVVLVDHSTKAADNPLHPSGSKRKRAAIGGASYLVEAMSPFVKDAGGKLRLTCAKDRHGNYRRGEVVADFVMASSGTTVGLNLYAPLELAPRSVPTILAAQAAVNAAKNHHEKHGTPLSRDSLVGLMKIKASTDVKRAGIDYAADLDSLTETAGPRNARLYTFSQELPDDLA